MKMRAHFGIFPGILFLATALGGCIVYRDGNPPPDSVGADPNASVGEPAAVTVEDFYGDPNLRANGDWQDDGDGRRCWSPSRVDRDWRPYTVGGWTETSAGVTWASEEPWAHTYHYGRWYERSEGRWVWYPDTAWSPAWVNWRSGNGYAGWAPMPPEHLHWREVRPANYVFVEQRYVTVKQVNNYIQPPARNVTIINQTTNITNIVNGKPDSRAVAPKLQQAGAKSFTSEPLKITPPPRTAARVTTPKSTDPAKVPANPTGHQSTNKSSDKTTGKIPDSGTHKGANTGSDKAKGEDEKKQ
jgi:hypothetical protein